MKPSVTLGIFHHFVGSQRFLQENPNFRVQTQFTFAKKWRGNSRKTLNCLNFQAIL